MSRAWLARGLGVVWLATAAGTAASGTAASGTAVAQERRPDVSGMAWISDSLLLAVHDAKNPDELDWPRVSLLRLPRSSDGMAWQPVELAWPAPLGPSSDLESVARIPGTGLLLLAESGEEVEGDRQHRRIFLVEWCGGRLVLRAVAPWPAPVVNVEGTAVARVGERLVFLYAERAQGASATALRWAALTLDPLGFGAFREIVLPAAAAVAPRARPVSALEVDGAGRLYVATATDPDDDNGPFRSGVWRIGRIAPAPDAAEGAAIKLDGVPERLATLDGLKVEGIAVRDLPGGGIEIVVGTDDENYGGVIRLLPGP
ncbi:MAG: hypothetical protein ABR559_09155 [Gemmatimonadota bacterium]